MIPSTYALSCTEYFPQDNTDLQYSSFRSNIIPLFFVVLLHSVLRKLYDGFWRADTYTQVRSPGANGLTMGLNASAAADARMDQRISFDVPFTVIFITALHGFSAFKIVAILYLNYCIAKKLPRPYVPAATWIFGVGILFANELGKGYSYATILGTFLPSTPTSEKDQPATNFGHTLDSFGGLIPRWEVLFNFTVLRLISFNMDYYWSTASRTTSPLEVRSSSSPDHILTPNPTLIPPRRNSSTPRTSRSATASPSPPNPPTTPSAPTSPTRSTPHSTSPAPSSPSTTTSPNCATGPTAFRPHAPSATPYASQSACSPWK